MFTAVNMDTYQKMQEALLQILQGQQQQMDELVKSRVEEIEAPICYLPGSWS